MTIHDIEVLFHAHTIAVPWPRGATAAYIESTERLKALGLIEPNPSIGFHGNNPYLSTEKGERHIERLRQLEIEP